MYLRFWGTRGSIPHPGPSTLRFGGNTACVEFRSAGGTLVVLDCGTGAHGLGKRLTEEGSGPLNGHLLITHTHWDHIQGFPFFQPMFAADGTWDIYGPFGLGQSLQGALAGQLQYEYFPVTPDQMGATQRFHELTEGVFEVGDIRVTTRFLNHPALTLGYRLEVDGAVVVYATDHEPHDRGLASGLEGAPHGEDARHADFLAGADLVIHDAQFTAAEYPERIGWGHSTIEYVVDLARFAGVGRVALFHHDPWRDDGALERLSAAARRRGAAPGRKVDVFAAAEGHAIQIERPEGRPVLRAGPAAGVPKAPQAVVPYVVLVAVADVDLGAMLRDVARASGFAATIVDNGVAALDAARVKRPSLVLVDQDLPLVDGLGVARALRHDPATYGADLPIVLVGRQQTESGRMAAEEAGVTDWLIRPFSAAYARARIQAWVMRAACRWQPAPLPPDEAERLAALKDLDILDTEPEDRFDRLTRMASRLLDFPVSAVTLVDMHRQWFKSVHGLGARQSTRDVAFCAHTILADEPLVVRDTFLDDRFADNPFVAGAPHIRFYAGVPLRTADGNRVGSFCVIDHRPRDLNEDAMRLLLDLASLAEDELRRGRVRAAAEGS